MFTSFMKISVLSLSMYLLNSTGAVAQPMLSGATQDLAAYGCRTPDKGMADSANRLQHYIELAFANNEGLKQQQFNLDKALWALKEAKGMFLPTVSLLASYTKADGGRTIDVPVGDLINPVNAALNQLTNSSNFPALENQSFLLNADNFYDTKIRTSLPLINAEIRYNKLIKNELISSQQASVNVYKRTLLKDVKTAYYRYDQSLQGILAYESARQLIRANIRENESFLRNGVRNGTALLRAQTELEKNATALNQAQRNARNAKAYFNFLLNRPLTDTIYTDQARIRSTTLAEADAGTGAREELKQLQNLRQVYTLNEKMHKSGFIPKLSTYVDLGTQGFDFDVNRKTRYYLWGVNLQWDIFTGGQRKYRAQQARSDINVTSSRIEDTEKAFQLELDRSYNNYQSALASLNSATAQLKLAEKYYRDQQRAYKAGQLLYLELIDAENQLTNSRLQLAEAEASLQITLAELERSQASYPLD